MAGVATFEDRGGSIRAFQLSVDEKKGLLLSHLLGFALFSEIALNIFKITIALTPPNSIPIRLLALWLLIDRNGRLGRFRLGVWDAIILGFVVLCAIGCIYTSFAAPGVEISFEDFRRFAGLFLNAYLYYVVAREGMNRIGFRPDITINWLIGGFAWSAIVSILQTLNLFHARSWSLIYANSALSSLREGANSLSSASDDNASLASGTAAWWNSNALEMLVAFALAFGPTFLRKPKWYEWALGMLFMGAFISSQSRGGLAAFAACAIATFLWFFIHKRYVVATVIGTVVGIGVVVWVFAVFALQIEKFTVTLQGEKVKGSVYSQSLTSRLEQQRQLIDIGMKLPVFGTGPNFGARNVDVFSPYSINGATDTNYGYMFAQFGVVGLAFLACIQIYLISFIRGRTAFRPYAFAAFFIGVAFSIHGLVEFLLYSRTFMVMNLLAAYAGSTLLVTEKGRETWRRVVRSARPVVTQQSPVQQASILQTPSPEV